MTKMKEVTNNNSAKSNSEELQQTSNSADPHINTKSVEVKAAASARQKVQIKTNASKAEILQAPIHTEPWLPTWVPSLLSVIAILISIANSIYGLRKDRRARKQSIQDDYWFRKIASPITIEPLVKNLLKISAELPDPAVITTQIAQSQWQQQTAEVEEFRTTIGALALLSKDLPKDLDQYVDVMSDELSNFYGHCMLDINTGSKISNRNKTKDALVDAMIKILKRIQEDQEKMGYSK
jgi:hypothetical protein